MSEENKDAKENIESKYEITTEKPEAIVIYCSDPRFQVAFEQFVEKELKLEKGKYIPLVVSGGIGSLSEPFILPKEFKFMKERIEYFLDNYRTIKLIVLINHEDCGRYKQMKDKLSGMFMKNFGDLIARQKIDLKKVWKIIVDFASFKSNVKLYYAKFADEEKKKVVFEEIKI